MPQKNSKSSATAAAAGGGSSSGSGEKSGDRRERELEDQQQHQHHSSQQQQQHKASQQQQHNDGEHGTSYSPSLLAVGLGSKAPPVITIALTGGPCAGKSTSLVAISTEVQRRTDFKVFCVPEAATLLVTGGLEWKDMTEERTVEYQLALLQTQLALEDNFKRIARACGRPAVVICDRGTMDGRSYCSPSQWDEICRRGGYETTQLRDARYDAVLHLVTAAIGAEEFYNLDNPARYETLEGARVADVKLRQMYVGHPRIRLIDNKPNESFQDKINASVDFVFQCIGHAPPRHDKRRFLLRWPAERAIPHDIKHEVVNVSSTILAQSTAQSYSVAMLRQSQNSGHVTRIYLVTGRDQKTPDFRSQQQLYLTEQEFNLLTEQSHPEHAPLEKRNFVFEHGGAFYELAVHLAPSWIAGFATLYVDGLQEGAALPAFLADAIETTESEQMSSFHQSQKSEAATVKSRLEAAATTPSRKKQ